MPTVKKLQITPDRTISVYGLASNKPAAAQRVAVSERGRVWLIDSKGTVRASWFGDIRCTRNYSAQKLVPLTFLQEDDIRALGSLGVIDAGEVIALQRGAFRNDFFQSAFDSIEYDVKALAEAGISVPKTWRKAAEAWANKKADERMAKKFPLTTKQ